MYSTDSLACRYQETIYYVYLKNPLESGILTGIHFLTFCTAILYSNLRQATLLYFKTVS